MIRVLFVCTGNTCRSPMAEAILKSKNLPGTEVKSAGIYAIDGNFASQHAQKVLEEQKIDHNHRSSLLTDAAVEWATHIFTMTLGHKQSILSMYPSAKGKVYTLKEFAQTEGHGDIMDPYGGPLDIYRYTYNEINENIERMIEKLKNLGAV